MTSIHAPLVFHVLAQAPLARLQKAIGGLATYTYTITLTQRSETELRRNRPARTPTVRNGQGTVRKNFKENQELTWQPDGPDGFLRGERH